MENLRVRVGEEFLKCRTSNKALELSQELDIPIVEKQRLLYEEYKKLKKRGA